MEQPALKGGNFRTTLVSSGRNDIPINKNTSLGEWRYDNAARGATAEKASDKKNNIRHPCQERNVMSISRVFRLTKSFKIYPIFILVEPIHEREDIPCQTSKETEN